MGRSADLEPNAGTDHTDRRHPGPKRAQGAPVGPEEVRAAVIEAAGDLFTQRGVDAVSLRDIAEAADVQLSLISRYVGSRADVLDAVLEHLSGQLVEALHDRPLEQVGLDREAILDRWTALLGYFAATGQALRVADLPYNPVLGAAEVIQAAFGTDDRGARLRGAQISASALGWRIFEDYLIRAGGLEDADLAELREELSALHRHIGALPWPTPADPPLPSSAPDWVGEPGAERAGPD
jgi:AcrR family transcriptional regulator